eukprot:757918_1
MSTEGDLALEALLDRIGPESDDEFKGDVSQTPDPMSTEMPHMIPAEMPEQTQIQTPTQSDRSPETSPARLRSSRTHSTRLQFMETALDPFLLSDDDFDISPAIQSSDTPSEMPHQTPHGTSHEMSHQISLEIPPETPLEMPHQTPHGTPYEMTHQTPHETPTPDTLPE